jgi:ABC-type proline/glycine betaine transport system permease subunit
MIKVPFRPLVGTLFVLGELTYLICFAASAIWSQTIDMRGLFSGIFPGFNGFDAVSLLIGLVWVAVYALYAAAVISWTWNFVAGRIEPAPG